MKNNASLVYSLFILVGDVLALLLAFVCAYLIRSHLFSAPVAHIVHVHTYVDVFLVMLPLWIILFALLGLYNRSIYEKRYNELGLLLVGSFIGMLFVVFWNYLSLHPILPSKAVPLIGFGLAYIFLVLFRNLARFIRTELFGFGLGLNHVLVVGNTLTTREIIDSISDSRDSGYKVLGVVSPQKALDRYHRIKFFARFSDALDNIGESIHTIVQTELYADESKNRDILEYAQTNHVAYRFVPGNTELFVGNLDVELFRNSLPVIAVHQTALVGWGRIVKRLFDFVFGSILLIVTSPIMLAVALVIKFSDGGSFFLRQVRLTRFNQEFRVFKFRSMKPEYNGPSPEEAFTAMGRKDLLKKFRDNGNFLEDDPRYTAIGRFIRKTSLDELPQLFNVIKGDLSLVGPRALLPQDLARYEKRHAILSVKSGITGLAQVSGRNNIPTEERRKLDLYYVQNWTFWLDLIILAKTIRVVLQGS